MATYRIRKMGTRRGQPHYGAECTLCLYGVLSIGHLDRPRAENIVREHMLNVHGRKVLAPKSSNSSPK